jgi:hypothetical protein
MWLKALLLGQSACAQVEPCVLVQVSNEAKRIAEHDPLSEDMIHEHDETSGGSSSTPALFSAAPGCVYPSRSPQHACAHSKQDKSS